MKPLALSRTKRERKDVQEELDHLVQKIVNQFQPVSIYLFGSLADGDFYTDSDIDLLIVCENDSRLKDSQKSIGSLLPLAPTSVEVVWMTLAEFDHKKEVGGVAFTAAQEGEELYHE